MNKKEYVAPELELLILEQTDIITTSGEMGGVVSNPGNGTVGGDNGGEEGGFGWDS